MEEEHTPTIIQLILSMDLTIIQLKDSHLILHISRHKHVHNSPKFYFDAPEGGLPMPRTWGKPVTNETVSAGVSINSLFIYPYIL